MKRMLQSLAGVLLGLAAMTAHGAWSLDNGDSRVSFVTVKKGQVAEVHRFTRVQGAVNAQGLANLAIDLASVDTRIPIRDERMRDLLFETGLYPRATFTTQVDPRALRTMAAGDSRTVTLAGQLDLHGEEQPVTAEVVITRLTRGRIQVATLEPILVNAADYALVQGVEKLREIAGLPSIANTVPVTFVLTFLR